MSQIRVAIGEVQSSLREEILVQITEQQPDMEFVGQIEKTNFKESIAQRNVEVLITEVAASEFPQVCNELFTEQNPPVVVGLARGGRDAAICIANTGVAKLTSVIRASTISKLVKTNSVFIGKNTMVGFQWCEFHDWVSGR